MKKWTHDPQEDDPIVGPIIEAALKEAAEMVEQEFKEKGYPPHMKGRVPGTWKRAAEILQRRHKIEWKNPMQMNPGLFVD